MNRKELDELVEHYRLTPPQVERALALAQARPTPSETLLVTIRTALLAGVLSLAAGVVFFVAANWSELRVLGRFVLLETLLLVTLTLALWRPPPQPVGRYALLAAFIVSGALLALYGQTYQTGANLYELFLTWAALGLPIVIAGQWTVLWAAWILVLNLTLCLFCGMRAEDAPFLFLASSARRTTTVLLVASLVNIALWALAEYLHSRVRPVSHLVPGPLRSLILACAITFVTWAGIQAIVGEYPPQTDGWSLLGVAGILAGIGVYTLRRRVDVLPLALIAASAIILVMSAIMEHASSGRVGTVKMALLMATWLIISSGVVARVIMNLLRSWRGAGETA